MSACEISVILADKSSSANSEKVWASQKKQGLPSFFIAVIRLTILAFLVRRIEQIVKRAFAIARSLCRRLSRFTNHLKPKSCIANFLKKKSVAIISFLSLGLPSMEEGIARVLYAWCHLLWLLNIVLYTLNDPLNDCWRNYDRQTSN